MTPSGGRNWLSAILRIESRSFSLSLASTTSVFVVACNQAGKNGEGLSFPATAVVIDPSGDVLAQDTSGEEGLLVVDLDAARLDHVRRHRMRYFLPNRRPDLYRKLLNDQVGAGSEQTGK